MRQSLLATAILIGLASGACRDAAGPDEPVARETMTQLLARCPSPAELQQIRAAVPTIEFSGDPAPAVYACTVAAGSADLTRLQARTYMMLLAMSRLQFREPLAWTSQSAFDWFRTQIAGMRYRSDMTQPFCCDPVRVINIQTGSGNLAIAVLDRFDAVAGAATLGLFVHEARHIVIGHTCAWQDRNVAELGDWGVQYHLLRLMATASDSTFILPSERPAIRAQATNLLASVFCEER